jgi:hypothetical protein
MFNRSFIETILIPIKRGAQRVTEYTPQPPTAIIRRVEWPAPPSKSLTLAVNLGRTEGQDQPLLHL